MSEWTIETLKQYVETLFAERQRALDAALTAQKEAVAAAFLSSENAIKKADYNAEKWRENANEWRAAMVDRESRFATRGAVDAIEKQVVALQLGESRGEGGSRAHAASREQSRWFIALTVTIGLALLSGIGSLIFFLVTK